jgi:pentatricopeptide repeat protein
LESFNLFEQLKERQIIPNLFTYNTLLSITSREGDTKRGLAVWDELIKAPGKF